MVKHNIYKIILTVILTFIWILLGIFCYRISCVRFLESIRDMAFSFGYYFCKLFGIPHNATPTVCGKSAIGLGVFTNINFTELKYLTLHYFSLLLSKDNFVSWYETAGGTIGDILKMIAIGLPCGILLGLIFKFLYTTGNTHHNKDTRPLKLFKNITYKLYLPVKRLIGRYIVFLRKYKWIVYIWAGIWLINLNIATIVLECIAYCIYFAISYDFFNLRIQSVKLFLDIQLFLRLCPLWLSAIIAYLVFHQKRKKTAIKRLRHFEARNCGFINELPIVTMACGSMGKKKTTLITDMTLSQEVMFRQRALEILQKNDMKFPYFPWLAFELELRKCMEYGTVYNLATVKEWVKLKERRFLKHKDAARQLYGYDYTRYGLFYDDALKISSLFDVLSTYAQAYFLYVTESSLIVSNYAVRTDNAILSNGNFPLWLTDFFSESQRKSRHSHILDFDALRLGKKVLEHNLNAGSFEFGVVAITEIGKERGNNLELREVKKSNEETNQKNDLFNSWLKMCRHSATIDNFPFIKVFTDEQRPESWGADSRDLCDILYITATGEQRLALPFYTLEEMFSEWAFDRFMRLYEDFRFRRGDNTLLVYILKSITAWIWKRHIKIYNRYGYSILKIEKERGTLDGKKEKKKYYLMNAKIYANRFSTDCFSDYFNELAKKSKVGLKDYLEYATEKASVEELKMQNSYFINSLYKEEK